MLIITEKKFLKRIPDAGTPSKDFILENFLPESWKNVKNLLLDFISNNENAPIGRTIEGEWGSGKSYITLFLEELINSEDQLATILPIPMGMIHKCYKEDERFSFYSKNSTHNAELLLCAIFIAGYDQGERLELENVAEKFSSFSETYKKIIQPDQSINLSDYIHQNLNILTKNGKQKLYIFIDEMEELIDKEYGTEIFESLSGIFNENIKFWGKGQKFGKNIRIILACTPEALFKFYSHSDFSEIYGKTLERAKIITLPKLPRRDAFKFLIKSLQWAMGNELISPKDLKISSIGILETISKVAQGNFRHLQSFTSTLVSKVMNFDKEAISFQEILETFPHLKVTDRFGSLTALNLENYERVKLFFENEFNVNSNEWILFNLLLGEQNPFSIEELSKRLSFLCKVELHNADIINLIRNIENLLQKENFSTSPFNKLCLIENYTFNEFIEKIVNLYALVFKKDDKKDLIFLSKGSISEDLDEIQKNIVFFEFLESKDLIYEKIFLGYDKSTLRNQFGSLIKDYESEVIKEFELEKKDIYYKLSTELLEKFFPSPIPITLSYIQNDQLRRNLWKDVKNQYHNYFETDLINGFIKCFERVDLDLKYDSRLKNNLYSFKFYDTHGNQADIKIKIFAHFGIIKREEPLQKIINDYESDFKNKQPYHLAILLHGEDFDNETRKFFADYIGLKKEGYILPIRINFNLGRRLIISNLIQKDEYADEYDEEILISEKKKILIEEINIQNKFIAILNNWRENGKLIEDIKISDFRDLLKTFNIFCFYVNEEENLTLDNLVQSYNNFHKNFKLYYSTIFYFPDFNRGSIENELKNLIDNKFLISKTNSTNEIYFSINNTQVEERIIRILLETNNFIHFPELELYFVTLSKNKDNFFSFKKVSKKKDIKIDNLFLSILERKGIISIEKNNENISLMDYELQKTNVLKCGEKIISELTKSLEQNLTWIYVYSSGHDKDQRIDFRNVKDFILKNVNSIKNYNFTNNNIYSLEFLKKTINLKNVQIYLEDLFEKYYPPIISNGINEFQLIDRNFSKSEIIFDKLKRNLENDLNVIIKLNQINDYNQIQEIKKEYFDLTKVNDINKFLKNEGTFKEKFEGSGKKLKIFHFSPKLVYFEELNEKYNNIVERSTNIINEINEFIDNYNSSKTNIRSELVKIYSINGLPIFNNTYEKIKEHYENFGKKTVSNFLTPKIEINLKEIQKKLLENQKPLADELKDIELAMKNLEKIREQEENYNILHNNLSDFLLDIKGKFIHLECVDKNLQKLKLINDNYQNLLKGYESEKIDILNTYTDDLSKGINQLSNDVTKISEDLNLIWLEKIKKFDLSSLEQKKKLIKDIDPSFIELINNFTDLIDRLKKIEILDLWKIKFKINGMQIPNFEYINNKFETITNRMKDVLREKYGQENIEILNYLFEIFKKEKIKKYYDIVNILSKEKNVSAENFTKFIKILEKDGILALNVEFKF